MNLKAQVLQGGAYLAARQTASIVIGLVGVILLTRMIGPTNYGLAAGAVGIIAMLGRIGTFGIDAFLIRRSSEPGQDVYHQAFGLLLLIGIVFVAAGYLLSPLLALWLGDRRFISPLLALLLTLPIILVTIPATAQLERDLNYRALAMWDLVGHIGYYVVALPLAFFHLGVWTPVAGFWTMQIVSAVRSYTLSGYRPGWYWSRPLLAEMVHYGFGFSASSWVWQARSLVNPLVVGRLLGPEAVGYVSLAIRFVEMMAFVKGVAWRLAMAALGKVQTDHGRLRRGLEEAMPLQVLALGPVLAGFALIGPWFFPLVFGPEWNEALRVYPFIALSYLINAVFNMHSSVLYVLGRNRDVALAHVVHIVLFTAGTLAFVPSMGIIGYGFGELVAMAGYIVVHLQVARVFPFSYRGVQAWLVGFIPPLFGVFLPLPWNLLLLLPLVVVVLWPRQRHQLREYLAYLPVPRRPAWIANRS